MRDAWTIPLDPRGLVIYFGVHGRPFFFNGHKGTFYDSLPPHAIEILDALSKPKEDQPGLFAALREKYGARCDKVLAEIRLYQSGTHPELAPETRQKGFCQKLAPTIFDIYVSQTCNLSCRYCLNQRGTFGKVGSLMSVETAKDVLAFISRTVAAGRRPRVSVTLLGGEPLLSRPAAYLLARGLQDLNRANLPTKVCIFLLTNGTIYDQEIFGVLAEEPDGHAVVVSMDAIKGTHDKNRPFSNPAQGSSYDTVLENLRRMKKAGVPTAVTCVVPYPYDYVASAEALHRLEIGRLEIKPVIRHIFGRPDLPDVLKADFQLWRKNYLAYSDYYLDHLGTKNPARHLDRLSIFGKYSAALGHRDETHRTVSCSVGDGKVSVASDGRLLPCQCFLGSGCEIGDVKNGFDAARHDRFEQWMLSEGQFRIENQRCMNCYAKLVCDGGCYAVSLDKTRRLEPMPESSCRFKKEMVKIDLYYISRMKKEHPEFVPGIADGSSRAEPT